MNFKLSNILIALLLVVVTHSVLIGDIQAADKKVTYSLKITDAAHHLAEVTVLFPTTQATSIDFIMPAWRLGKYKILNLANGIRHFTVTDAKGNELTANKIDKNTWRLNLDKPAKLAVSYQLYANQLSLRTRHIDDSHAYLDGASSFIYSPEFMDLPLSVTLNVPKGWRSQSGMTRRNKHSFTADDYNTLASSPIETGIHEYYSFTADDRDYEVVIWGKGNFDGKKIVDDYKKMVIEHGKMWGDYPFQRYLFIIHSTAGATGATEHINSTVIQRDALGFANAEDYKKFLSTSSHEFVHTWNVKAYRPVGIAEYDYVTENYSDLLWIAEGSTSYFSQILLVRAGLLKAEDFLADLAKAVQTYQSRPGRKVMTMQQASFDAWIEGKGDRANNSSVNIYSKGSLLSLLIDIELLKATEAEAGYQQLHKLLYQRYPAADKGFSATDIQNLMQEISSQDYSKFWKSNVESTSEIDFTELFLSLGLSYSEKEPKKKQLNNAAEKITKTKKIAGLWTGIELEETKIIVVPEGSPAWQAGLAENDILLAINGMRVEANKLALLLKTFKIGDEVQVSYFRRNILKETTMELSEMTPEKLHLSHLDEASEMQKKMYEKWLGVDWPSASASASDQIEIKEDK